MPNNFTRRKQFSERPRVKLGIGRLKLSVPLVHVRAYFISINLMVFLSALSSFSAGRDASIFNNENLCVECEEHIKHVENIINDIVANAVNNYIENILYITSVILFIHWIVNGVAIPSRFDGTFEKCALAAWTVHTLVTVVWEMGLAVVLLKLEEVIPTQHPMSRLYSKWTTTLVILLVAIVPVQLVTVLLPFFCFEDDLVYVEDYKIWHTAAATEMNWTTHAATEMHWTTHAAIEMHWTTHKSPVPSLYYTQMPKSLVPSLHHTQTTKLLVPSLHNTQMPRSCVPSIHNTQMPKSRVPRPKLLVPSLYLTEMPEQIIKKSKPSRTNRLTRDEVNGHVEEFPKRNNLSCLEDDYIYMLGRSPPPSYHSQDHLNSQ